jgi:AI-2 transport protein TqsA
MADALASHISRNALVIIAVVVMGAALHWMQAIINPLLLAVFLAVMVDGFSRVIRRHLRAVPHWFPTAAAIVISTLLFGACAFVVAINAEAFVATLGRDAPKLDAMISSVSARLGPHAPKSVAEILNTLDPMQYLSAVGAGLQDFASDAFLVLVYLGFLIAARHTFERKAVKLFHTRERRHEARRLFLRIRDSLERYLWIQTVLGLVIAAASWLVMVLLRLDNAFFWAFLVFVLNYIPIIGAVAAVVLPALFALLQFDGWTQAAILLAALLAISFFVGNVMLPRMQGDSLNMDPLVVLLSLAFWGAIWGLTGMFLSTPLTVLVMVILAEFDGSRWIAVLLSADGDPQSLGRRAGKAPDQPDAAAA